MYQIYVDLFSTAAQQDNTFDGRNVSTNQVIATENQITYTTDILDIGWASIWPPSFEVV